MNYDNVIRCTSKVDFQNTNYFLVGLAGEVGEVMNVWQKHLRGDKPRSEELRQRLLAELGGAFWFLHAACISLGSTAEEVKQNNATELMSRLARGTIQGDGDHR